MRKLDVLTRPPAPPTSNQHISPTQSLQRAQLVEMGFAEIRAKKALMFGNGNDMENAVNWIMEHQEDADIDEPIPEGDTAAAAAMDVDSGAAAAAGT